MSCGSFFKDATIFGDLVGVKGRLLGSTEGWGSQDAMGGKRVLDASVTSCTAFTTLVCMPLSFESSKSSWLPGVSSSKISFSATWSLFLFWPALSVLPHFEQAPCSRIFTFSVSSCKNVTVLTNTSSLNSFSSPFLPFPSSASSSAGS